MNPPPTSAKVRLDTDLLRARSLLELNTRFCAHAGAFGFTAYAAGYIPNQGIERKYANPPFLFISWPRAWLELYASEGFAGEDPVLAEAAESTEPFTWGELRARRPGESERMYAAAADFGWRDGLVVPVRDEASPEAPAGIVSLAAPDLAGFDATRRARMVALARLAFRRAQELAAQGSEYAALSGRERDVLALVAKGLDDADIGVVLGISRTTAHYHVENAKGRLGAGTRAQAVALAIARGWIDAEP